MTNLATHYPNARYEAPEMHFESPALCCDEDLLGRLFFEPYRNVEPQGWNQSPGISLTRMVDKFHMTLLDTLYEEVPAAFNAPVGSFAHFLSLCSTHLRYMFYRGAPGFQHEKLRLQLLLRYINPSTMIYDPPEGPTQAFIRHFIPSLKLPEPYFWIGGPNTQDTDVLHLLYSFPDRVEEVRTPWVWWRCHVNRNLTWEDFELSEWGEEVRQFGYGSTTATNHIQFQQWFIRLCAADLLYEITVPRSIQDWVEFDRDKAPTPDRPPRPPGADPDYEAPLPGDRRDGGRAHQWRSGRGTRGRGRGRGSFHGGGPYRYNDFDPVGEWDTWSAP